MKHLMPHRDFRLVSGGKTFHWIGFQNEYPNNSITRFLNTWCTTNPDLFAQTSGTTGAPKTTALKKSAMQASAEKTGAFLNLGPKTKALLCLSPEIIAGKMMLVRAWVLGWELTVVAPTAQPLQEVAGNFDFAAVVPHQAAASLTDLNRVTLLIVGGGEIPFALWQHLTQLKTTVYQTFGATETVSHFAMRRVIGAQEYQSYTCLPGIEVAADAHSCLVVKAPGLLAAPLETNDVVTIIDQHHFFWHGRADHAINSGGVKLHPEVLESRLAAMGFKDVLFIGARHHTLGEQLVLVVKTLQGIDATTFKNWHPYEVPKKIVAFADWPLTGNGKVRRAALVEKLQTAGEI